MNKKVLIFVNHDLVIYNFRKELVEELIEKGFEVVISSPEGNRLSYFIKKGCKVRIIKMDRKTKNPFKDIKLLIEYIKLIKEELPGVILTYTIKPNIYGGMAASILKIPFISNITGLGTAVEKKGALQKITLFLYKLAFKKVNKIYFQNEENSELFIKNNIGLNKSTIIPGSGVNLKEYQIMKYPNDKIINFAFISRIMKEKGIEEYLETAKYIRAKYPNTQFHVCGFCEEEYEEILEDYHSRKIIHYHGMVQDIKKVLDSIHCVIHPSFYPEGVSNILLEAAASGKPLITTNRSGCKEVVLDGINGYLIDIKNKQQLIKKVEEFMDKSLSEKRIMGLEGRKLVESKFDRNIVVSEYMITIDEILRNDEYKEV